VRYKLSIPVTAFLITLTILVITAFQAYWLHKNYLEEKKLFTSLTNVLFRETIFRLQASKMKMDPAINIQIQDVKEGTINMAGAMPVYQKTTAATRPALQRTLFIARSEMTHLDKDSFNVHFKDHSIASVRPTNFMPSVDSLLDSITVKEITERYQKVLEQDKITVPFSILARSLKPNAMAQLVYPDYVEDNSVIIGFTQPISYQVLFENNTWYLLKRISQPILISVLLLGVTMFSFLLLYRNLKQQQKLALLKNDFINNMTHELKTPIATVSVAIEALRNFDALEDLQRTNEYLDISATEIQRLSLLVDKVLKLSMFENKEITLNKEPFNITDLARGVIVSMKLQFEKQHAVTTLKSTGNNFTITADKLHITSVLYNMLDNALKYSTKDPNILIHLIDHKQYLEIRVTDNGIGIPREYQTKIFEKFFRVPSGNRHNIKGYGLGLSYVTHIIQRHMGFITVESELNKGSTFSVKLPFTEAPVIHYEKGRRIVNKKIG
jgi:two-component system phosphate regulon sensor histidine kinase PhoR